jgi:hypothetical protein
MTRVMRSRVIKSLTALVIPPWALALVLASAAGCAATTSGAARPQPATVGVEPNPTAGSSPATTQPSGAVPGAPLATSPAHIPGHRLPEIVLDPKQPLRPLPELKVENIGLHIGGGPNDPETKAPFLSAIAERFPSFMDCYRKNEDPAQGGRFGVDLHVTRSGGHPRIEQPRTSLRGADFRACLSGVFESVDFKKPKHGPTTLSYSLRFTLVEAP